MISSVTPEVLEYLSHSRLEAYRSCSLKFKLHYIDKIPAAFTPASLAFGVAFHAAVEDSLVALMAGSLPPIDDLVQVFSRALDEQVARAPIRFGEKEDRDSMRDLARRMLEAWTAWPRPKARILAVEHEFRIPIATWLPPILGRVDLIEADEEGFVNVIDVKTSRGRWSQQDVIEHSGQLALYQAAVQEISKDLGKPIRLGFEIITKAKTPVVERFYLGEGGESLERQIRSATMVLEAVERGIHLPSPSWACATCPWAGPCKEW